MKRKKSCHQLNLTHDLLKASQVLYGFSYDFQRNVAQDLLLNTGNGKQTAPNPEALSDFLTENIDMDRFKAQLPMVHMK